MSASERYRQLLSVPQTPPLKRYRHEKWLAAAAATLNRSQSPREICRQWSDAADQILIGAWKAAGLDQMNVALFALGKLGARELNLSSDVDLVALAGEPPTSLMLKALRDFVKNVGETDEYGFALRIDFDLRPGGRFGPTISTLKEAENYYWEHGAAWERLALVRLRPLTGNQDVIDSFVELARKFTYRRYIDFSFLEQLKSLRAQIHHHYENPDHYNIKLGVGGIRDIELFCHALQVIHGGRNPEVRHYNTHEAFERLIQHKLYDAESLRQLREIYWRWRQVENELQAAEDQQTHLLPRAHPLAADFAADSARVDRIVSDLLGKPAKRPGLPSSWEEQQAWLAAKGLSERSRTELWPRLLHLTAKSTRAGDEDMRREFLYLFIEQLHEVGLDKDLGLHLLDDFVRATRAKAAFFSLFVNEKRLIRDLARLFSISPYLGGILASRPELVDSYLFKAQAAAPPAGEELLEYLTEKRLLNEIISATAFLESHNVSALGHELTLTADQIAETLLARLCAENDAAPVGIVALGKWGGQELGLHSDLDFIFLCDSPPTPAEQKVAKRFITRLTEPHRGGMIYSIDLRLRPSGKAGPVLIEKSRLLEYLKQDAAAWERQSYLRARGIGALTTFADAEIRPCLRARPLTATDLAQLRDIRGRLLKPLGQQVSLKYAEGGLVDIEFAAQIATLAAGAKGATPSTLGMLRELSANTLEKHYYFLRKIEQLYRLVSETSRDVVSVDDQNFMRLAELLKTPVAELFDEICASLHAARAAVKALDPIYTPS